MMPIGPYASITVNPGKATGTTKKAKKANPKSTTKSAGAPKATSRVRKAKAFPDIDFDEASGAVLRRQHCAERLKPPQLSVALDRVGFIFFDIVAERMHSTLHRTVAASSDPYSAEVLQVIASKFLVEDLLSTAAVSDVARAWVAYSLAKHAHESGDDAAAWYHLSEAQFHHGRMVGDYNALREATRLKEAGSAGGRKAALKRNPLMLEGIKLLADTRKVGWDSPKSAYAGIESALREFAIVEGELDKPERLEAIVLGWLDNREDFAALYESGKKLPV